MRTISSLLAVFAVVIATPCTLASLGRNYAAPKSDIYTSCSESECGNPLYLTPLLEKGEIETARSQATVQGIGSFTSYSGYFTVDKATDSNTFFWYFPPQSGKSDAPLLVWLQGGPGGASTFAIFNEAGPFRLTREMELETNPFTWNLEYGMVFIDNPRGTGFSFTGSESSYCTNKQCYGNDLYNAMTQFYTMFPELVANDLYITGESYGGKYVPMMAWTIHENNQVIENAAKGETGLNSMNLRHTSSGRTHEQLLAQFPFAKKMNLRGISVGDGWCDPPNMIFAYPDLMYNYGLVDMNQYNVIRSYVNNMSNYIVGHDYTAAYTLWDAMLNGDLSGYPTLWANYTGNTDYFNIMRDASPEQFNYYASYLTQPSIRKLIHVGGKPMHSGLEVEMKLIPDVMQTMRPELATLMTYYKVLIYSGQLDVIIGGALTERFLPLVEWPGRQEYINTGRTIWRHNGTIAGYVRQVLNFTQAIVRGSGHILPYDQPSRGLDMLTRFIEDKPFSS